MRIVVTALVVVAASSAMAETKPAKGPADRPGKVDTIRVELILPRFQGDRTEFKAHPGLKEALEGAPPVLKAEDALFSFSFTNAKKENIVGFTTRIMFDPAKGDVGDVAKAVAAVKVPEAVKTQPAAILVVFPVSRERITDELSDRVWKAMKEVKGIDLEESRKLIQVSAYGIVLLGEGGAKYADIAAAFKAGGVPLQVR